MTTTFPGNICRTRDLAALGWHRSDIRRALADGRLRRLRPGWYATRDADEAAARAVAAGGSLACASALAFHGAWDASAHTVHVRLDHNRTAALPAGLHRCRPRGADADRAPDRAVDDVDLALRTAWYCLPRDEFVAVCDSLLHRRLMTPGGLALALGPLPGRDAVLARCDVAESGTETLVRLRLRRLGVAVRTQVWLTAQDRVDILVGDRLVLEVDSRAHHTGSEHYASDRARDLRLRSLGYIVVRLTYQQVVLDWPATLASLLAMVRRGDHRWPGHRAPAADGSGLPRRRAA